ncbi:MAG: tetratricopeptide repeat protein, partial [Anaerolineae bacterium]
VARLFDRPPLHEGYYREALEYYHAGELSRALASLDLCLRLAPDDAQALRLSAAVYALTGRLDRADSHVARLLILSPGDSASLKLAAYIGVAREKRQRAPLLWRAVAERPSAAGSSVARLQAPSGARSRTCRTALAALASRVGLTALVEWAKTRTGRHRDG